MHSPTLTNNGLTFAAAFIVLC